VEVLPVKWQQLKKKQQEESSESIRKRVMQAILLQKKSFQDTHYQFNAEIEAADMDRFCHLGETQQKQMGKFTRQWG
jgi:magnesium chelatase family protein